MRFHPTLADFFNSGSLVGAGYLCHFISQEGWRLATFLGLVATLLFAFTGRHWAKGEGLMHETVLPIFAPLMGVGLYFFWFYPA